MTKIRNKTHEQNDFARVWRNITVSVEGLIMVWREERTFQQWALVNLISNIMLIILRPGWVAAAIIVFVGLQILIAELLNTAIEAVIDFLDKDHHPLTKLAKDAGSAAVALAAIGLAFAWICVLVLHFA